MRRSTGCGPAGYSPGNSLNDKILGGTFSGYHTQFKKGKSPGPSDYKVDSSLTLKKAPQFTMKSSEKLAFLSAKNNQTPGVGTYGSATKMTNTGVAAFPKHRPSLRRAITPDPG